MHIDASGKLPRAGAPDEYAALFEAVWSAERDRQTYIDSKIKGGKPSYGHVALATFMQGDKARLVWTTNFDPLVADGCAKVDGGTGQLTIATPDAPHLAKNALQAERWPIEIKLHGDFRSRRLKNTTDELRHQDEYLRRTFVECGYRYGLIVAGYSGRDDSIMDTFEEVLKCECRFHVCHSTARGRIRLPCRTCGKGSGRIAEYPRYGLSRSPMRSFYGLQVAPRL